MILGILSAVALPRLSATKDDAKKSALMSDVKTCISDLTSYYQARGTSLDINSSKSCSQANENGASISYLDDSILISNSGSDSMDGNYTYKGTSVVY